MDTKSKKSKMIISLAAWIIGTSIILVNVVFLCLEIFYFNNGFSGFKQSIEDTYKGDYQDTYGFESHMSGLIKDFLTISVNGPIYDYYGYGYYDGYEINAVAAEEIAATEVAVAGIDTNEETTYEYAPTEENPSAVEESQAHSYEERGNDPAQNLKDAKEYHDAMKDNKSILYSIENNGKVLYTNYENLGTTWESMPGEYNYWICFDGTKVSAVKDGKNVDIYGDGYYKESSGWEVPGYKNFPVDNAIRQSKIYIAVAKVPSMMIIRNYNDQGSSYYSNTLSNIEEMHRSKRIKYDFFLYSSIGALILIALSFLMKKDKKQAKIELASITGKMWYEVKLLLISPCVVAFLIAAAYFVSHGAIYQVVDWIQMGGSGNEFGVWWDYSYSLSLVVVSYVMAVIWFFFTWVFINDSCRNNKPWKNSIVCRMAKLLKASFLKMPITKRMVRRYTWIVVIGGLLSFFAVASFMIVFNDNSYEPAVMIMAIGLVLLFTAFWISHYLFAKNNVETAKDLECLVERIQDVHDGKLDRSKGNSVNSVEEDLAQEIKVKDSDLAEAFNNLEEIQSGMNAALEEQVKSERMKVELIANVSHDIKTPLTSIISYVELMKQEENLPEHVKEYISILESKSQRLKTMVQDVFEVSKAASGELPVKMEDLDIGKLIRQTLADMAEQIETADITIKEEIPETAVMIHADGERLYRVFQNLILNAVKYSLEGSRVYVTLQENGQAAVACVKNISKEEISGAVDFTERFARGDKSRSDGGSGLGLSIAQSFTEACGGSFKVETIADLFVVTLSFSKVLGEGKEVEK